MSIAPGGRDFTVAWSSYISSRLWLDGLLHSTWSVLLPCSRFAYQERDIKIM